MRCKLSFPFIFQPCSRIIEGKETDDPKTIPLKIFAKDIGNCAYVRSSSSLGGSQQYRYHMSVPQVGTISCLFVPRRPGQDTGGQQHGHDQRRHPHGSAAVWHIGERAITNVGTQPESTFKAKYKVLKQTLEWFCDVTASYGIKFGCSVLALPFETLVCSNLRFKTCRTYKKVLYWSQKSVEAVNRGLKNVHVDQDLKSKSCLAKCLQRTQYFMSWVSWTFSFSGLCQRPPVVGELQ